ncbi:dolichyl pyrophosphate Man9GlcNAc2 alpha-1,3-glucosyltransferase [Aureococcus anophagefferens]|nr:dolichyl pyrophosphate Man9GlcNAc2 alpha-1,3-glucosyltransferase [Aureococcus anophagefferens]
MAAPSPTSGSTSPTGGGTYWRVFVACACVKILFWPSYHSTDFEVHRNWLAVTASTPMAYWYADQPKQSPWTLDYPPLFGVFERFLSYFAKLADPMILACLGGGVAVASGGAPEFAVLFAGPGLASLFVVDHVHFQYNGVFLGVLACCAGFLVKGQHVRAAVAFTLLMCMKHLFLTLAPFSGVYLLFAHVLAEKTTLGEKVLRLVDLGAAVTATAAASLAPLVVPAFHDRGGLAGVGAAVVELKGRLFPFGDRGLVHSYWAPNAWALYAFLDRVAMKASGREGGGETRGVVETQIEYLPAPGPLHCALLTLLAAAPALLAAARTASTQSGARGIALPALAHACLAAFAFGWHVHEKFLIVALVPSRRHPLLPADLAARLEFLPLMLTSVYCAAWVSALSLLSAGRLLYVAYRADASAW